MKMTHLDEIKDIYNKLKDRYKSLSIRYLSREKVEAQRKKMLDALESNLMMLENRKTDYLEIKKTFTTELKNLSKRMEDTKKNIIHLNDDIKKVELARIQAKSCILLAKQQYDQMEENDALIFGRKALHEMAARTGV